MKTRVLGLGILMAVVMTSAKATLITDEHIVTVGDKEWAQVSLFTNLSWEDVNEVCSETTGACSGDQLLNGWTMAGWTWASIFDVGELFQAETPHPGEIAVIREFRSAWAPRFFDILGFTPTNAGTGFRQILGVTRDLIENGDPDATPRARAALFSQTDGPFGGQSDFADTTGFIQADQGFGTWGHWFYRPTSSVPVPAPTTLPLLGLALGLLAAFRRIGRRTR